MALDGLTLSAQILNADYSLAQDLATGHALFNLTRGFGLTSGTGLNQADKIWADTRIIAASGTDDLDLAGVLTDAFGASITFARIKAMLIYAWGANTNNVVVGAAASNQFINWVGAGTHTVNVRPGGLLLLATPDATAYAVTAGTGDLLRVANSAGGTGVTYDICLIGSSA